MRGSHNAENALAAIAIAERLGVAEEVIAATLASFPGLPHRCELVAELDGTTFINDSKSTNPGSTIAAIKGFAGTSESLTVLIGGQTKDANFSALRDALIDNKATVVIYGEDGRILERSFQGCSATRVSTLDEALKVAVAASTTASNTDHIVLFSPACASFDQFENFEARGERFRSLVQGMN
jgi:UDP-N-acetylmuramoylalanine--D-glutamate ligase